MIEIVNAIVCVLAAWACFCRLNASNTHVLVPVRVYLSFMQACTLASACTPLLGQVVTWGQLLMGCAVLAGLLLSTWRWRHGPPAEMLGNREFVQRVVVAFRSIF